MFHRWTLINDAVVAKVVNVLNERFYFAHCLAFSCLSPGLSIATHTIAREGLAQNVNKRLVAGQEDAIELVGFFPTLSGNVQAN